MCLLHTDYAPSPVPVAAAAAKPGKISRQPCLWALQAVCHMETIEKAVSISSILF